MYYWEPAPARPTWTPIYVGVPPLEGIEVSLPSQTITAKVVYDPLEARKDSTLRNFKRSAEQNPEKFTYINVGVCALVADDVAFPSVELLMPETLLSYAFEFRGVAKKLRIMPKGITTPISVFVSNSRWTQKKFDKI